MRFIPKRIELKLKNFGFGCYCPICSSWVKGFRSYGLAKRADAQCPVCGLLERHRMVWLYFLQKTNLFDRKAKKMLHIAPEREFENKLKRLAGLDYITGDLNRADVMEKIDIENIQHPDNSFDVIYCCHVLEHVPDDVKAMREFCRVLKPGGWALLLVPITADKTFEDPTVTDPAEREKLFGQHDHVRQYGPDAIERFNKAGFIVEEYLPKDFLNPKQISRFRIQPEPMYLCKKQG